MTDKQIIIDVDVSGCDFLVKEDDYCSYSGEYRGYKGQCGCSDEEMCKDHPNCFYKKALKRLARKEQENERLKSELQVKELELIMAKADLCRGCQYKNDYKVKTQECEELKEYHNKCCQEFEKEKQDLINKYNQLSRDFYSGKYCDAEKCQQLNQLKASKEQAEQKLERIRQVLKNGVKIHDDIIVNKSILQIIDEVNDEIKRLKA